MTNNIFTHDLMFLFMIGPLFSHPTEYYHILTIFLTPHKLERLVGWRAMQYYRGAKTYGTQ